jgi:ATP-dependent DNA helicase RecG
VSLQEEVSALVETARLADTVGRGQPVDDAAVAPGATVADLDATEVDRMVERFRRRRGQAFSRFGASEVLRMAGVSPRGGDEGQVTLAGLLALGVYPQQFFPQLNVTFVSYPTVDGRAMRDGTRFLDNAALDGPIPTMVAGLLDVVQRNMARRSVVIGAGREDVWDYPVEAVRELAVNALMHRDYHPLAQGSQVRVEMYPDRLVFINPGGLYGAATTAELLRGTVSSSRNATLARLLEDVEIPGTNRTVCENRGSGIRTILAELASTGLGPPTLRSSGGIFTAELRSREQSQIEAPVRAAAPAGRGDTTSAGAILSALATGPKSTADLMALTGLSRAGVGRNLRALEAEGLTRATENRRSRTVRWELARPVPS